MLKTMCFSLRLFVVVGGGEHIAMAMVVTSVHKISVIHNIMY